ncbi:MAG: hypothetical protein WCU88_04835 [Elusimicrobiota bacterium]|jgi:hypothetical protein
MGARSRAAFAALLLASPAFAQHPGTPPAPGRPESASAVLASSAAVPSFAAPAAPSQGHLQLGVVMTPQAGLHIRGLDAFERLLREDSSTYMLLRSATLLSQHDARTYHFRLAEPEISRSQGSSEVSTASVSALETPDALFVVLGDDPVLLDRFERLLRDPASYAPPVDVRPVRRRAELSSTSSEDGERLITLYFPEEGRPGSAQWRNTSAVVFTLLHAGREVPVVFLGKTLGGAGRLASVMEQLKGQGSKPLLLCRYGVFPPVGPADGIEPVLRMERLGLRALVPWADDLRRWRDIEEYLRRRPEGVRFLAANLVDSAKPPGQALAPYAVFEVEGRRVGVLGLLRPAWSDALPAQAARKLRVEDPVEAAKRWVPELRKRCDVLVALTNLTPADNARLSSQVGGIDIVAGDAVFENPGNASGTLRVSDPERSPYDAPLLTSTDWLGVLTLLDVEHHPLSGGDYSISVSASHRFLDESVQDAAGYPDIDLGSYGISADSATPLLPSVRRLYAQDRGLPLLRKKDFWSLAASLCADAAGAEAAFLPVYPVVTVTAGDFSEDMVSAWLQREDRLAVFDLPGAEFKKLLAQVRSQESREQSREGLPPELLRAAAGGFGSEDRLHGEPIDESADYRVASTERLLARSADYPALSQARNIRFLGDLREKVLEGLRELAFEGSGDERYRSLLQGRPLREQGLWRVYFRDMSANISNTSVSRDEAFTRVSNSRIQGYDELLLGATAKVDADRLDNAYRWSNTLEAEYARSRLRPPGRPAIINVPTNRLLMRTVGTLRSAQFPWRWMAESVGPSVGLQYDGEIEKTPGLRRKQVYSLFPGVEFFGGSWVKTLSLSANIKRDLSRDTANNQYGVRGRAMVAHAVGAGSLLGEVWSNYFVRTSQDTDQDLLWEGDLNIKLRVPVFRQAWVAPFVDFYVFSLKTRRLAGYSAMTGVSIGFSRIWKPGYEKF